jgi:hypothetical protein
MTKELRWLALVALVVLVAGACSKGDDASPTAAPPTDSNATTTPPPTGSDTPSPVTGSLKIVSFTAPKQNTCTGNLASIPGSWETSGASSVEFSVDGEPVSMGAGYPVTGESDILVPCDGDKHVIELTATSPKDKSVSDEIVVDTKIGSMESSSPN